VAVEDTQALFAPDWPGETGDLDNLAYAVYGFSLEGFSGEPLVNLAWAEPPAGGDQYAAVYNDARSAWDWWGPAASSIELAQLADYDSDGTLYVAAAVTGQDIARLHMVTLGHPDCETDLPVGEITLPAGFEISVYSDDVPNARGMVLSENGTLYVGSRSADDVYAVRDLNGDGCADEVITVASGFDAPVGVDLRDGDLYFSNYDKIWRMEDIDDRLYDLPTPELVTDAYPTETHHGWKFIKFGPDGKLYVPVGAPCNICDEGDPYAAIHRMNPDGSGIELVARGVRNTVGFDWHPVTGELWFTDNGRDLLGDNVPPDELNRIPADFPGIPHFGYPYWHGNDVEDPQFGEGHSADEFELPARELGPHVAALGMRFYTGEQFPAEYHNQVFIAEHGSWNRSEPLGARVMLVRVAEDNKTTTSYEIFAEGWQRGDGSRWGRPVDVLVMPDGSLLVSDDLAGAVYRISYTGE
jgi:glucose/arabinose dehydrogenase